MAWKTAETAIVSNDTPMEALRLSSVWASGHDSFDVRACLLSDAHRSVSDFYWTQQTCLDCGSKCRSFRDMAGRVPCRKPSDVVKRDVYFSWKRNLWKRVCEAVCTVMRIISQEAHSAGCTHERRLTLKHEFAAAFVSIALNKVLLVKNELVQQWTKSNC